MTNKSPEKQFGRIILNACDPPTLDYKGRINNEMLHVYPGLYNKIKMRKFVSSKPTEKDKEVYHAVT